MKTVIEMAREAAIAVHNDARQSIEGELENLERFAALVREDTIDKFNRQINQYCEEARLLDDGEKQQEPVAWVKAKELAIAKSLSDDGYAKQWSTTLGFKKEDGDIPLYTTPPTIEAAVLAEREACAKVCESLFDSDDDSCNESEQCAAAIRARGE